MIPPGPVVKGGPSAPVTLTPCVLETGNPVAGGDLSAHVIPAMIPSGTGMMTGGAGRCAPMSLPARGPGNIAGAAEIETHTFNVAPHGCEVNATLARGPSGWMTPRGAGTVSVPTLGPLLPRLGGLGVTPLPATCAKANRVPPTLRRVGWVEAGQRAMGSSPPSVAE